MIDTLNELDIAAWLDWMGIDYRRTHGSHGAQLNLRECPFCGDDRWKVYINEETGLGNCFHGDCETKFNKFKFIRASLQAKNASEVRKNLEAFDEIHGWRPKVEKPKPVQITVSTNDYKLPPYTPITEQTPNAYLQQRGISTEACEYFKLGDCTNGSYEYKANGSWVQKDFSNRIIIPIFDLDGQLVSFQGRDVTGQSKSKYMFPAGLKATGALLYNGFNAIGAKNIVICEGVFDVIAVWQAFKEKGMSEFVPVGTFGKHLSHGDLDSQLGRLLTLKEKGLKTITMMWDGEPQAIADAIKTGQMLQKYGFAVRIATLPGKDPNELPNVIVRQAFWNATPLTPQSVMTLKLKYRK